MLKVIVLVVVVIAGLLVAQRYSANSPEKKQALLEANRLGQEFLEKNKTVEGVQSTESGLQYQFLNKGDGTQHPTANDKVKVHYHGTLIDGTVFDSSVNRGQPISFGLNQVIKGWTEGLQLMKEGDKMRLFIPSELGYGKRAAGKIPPNSVLIFDVELLGINQ